MNNSINSKLFHIKNIKKNFKNGCGIFFDGDIELYRGRLTFITGNNGIGKSTFLNMLGTLEQAAFSEESLLHYYVNDDILDYKKLYKKMSFSFNIVDFLAKLRRENFGFLPQAGHLIDSLTIFENLQITQIIKDRYLQKNDISEMLDPMFSDDSRDGTVSADNIKKSPSILSGGYKQRLALNRAILSAPDVIFADEPTNNMDSKVIDETIKKLGEYIKTGGSVIMVAHNFKELWEKTKIFFPDLLYDRLDLILNSTKKEDSEKWKRIILKKNSMGK
jgi:putative ABC transport system ATP-binding protein